MFCTRCGAELPRGAEFCPHCGAPARAKKTPWHSRGALAPDDPRRRRVNLAAVLSLLALQFVLSAAFSGFSLNEPEPAAAQAVGLVPTLLLILYIYCLDTLDKEPLWLLLGLFVLEGIVCETVVLFAELGLEALFSPPDGGISTAYRLLDAFLLVALVEELGKYAVLKLLTWRSKAFNCRFDGIVYAAVTALGFAAFENFGYVASYGLDAALSRSVTAVPGHCVDGILMGIFYGQAKVFAARGAKRRAARYRRLAVLAPALEHGFYDFAAGSENEMLRTLFFFYVLLLNAAVFTAVWRLAQKDEAISLSAKTAR